MKLLTTTNRYYLALVALIFAIGTIVLYYGMQVALAHEVDEQLLFHRQYLTEHIRKTGLLPTVTNPNELTISATLHVSGIVDTLLYDAAEQTNVPFRAVSFAVEANGQRRWLTLRKSLIETEEAVGVTSGLMLGIMSLLCASVLLLNRWLSRWLWAPFRHTLAALRGYALHQPQALLLPATAVDEFSELNQAVTQLTDRVAADYRALKEFTENAAHETQTPLAIMQAKLEQLMQLPDLPAAATSPVQELYQATLRLSRLHHALALLSKIENRQFTAATPVQLDALVSEKIAQLQDFVDAKCIRLTLTVTAPLIVTMNATLADSLVGNLLQNAIKHNHPGGRLQIRISATGLEITNTGPTLTIDPTQLLERFRKHNAASDSPGLGLSIVQQICTLYNFQLRYTFSPDQSLHTLRVQV